MKIFCGCHVEIERAWDSHIDERFAGESWYHDDRMRPQYRLERQAPSVRIAEQIHETRLFVRAVMPPRRFDLDLRTQHYCVDGLPRRQVRSVQLERNRGYSGIRQGLRAFDFEVQLRHSWPRAERMPFASARRRICRFRATFPFRRKVRASEGGLRRRACSTRRLARCNTRRARRAKHPLDSPVAPPRPAATASESNCSPLLHPRCRALEAIPSLLRDSDKTQPSARAEYCRRRTPSRSESTSCSTERQPVEIQASNAR